MRWSICWFYEITTLDSNFKLINKSNYYAFIHQKDKPVLTLHLGNEKRIEKYGYSIYKREILNKSNGLKRSAKYFSKRLIRN